MDIRPIKRDDYDAWLPLWQENCLHQISDEITMETWRRITNKNEHVFGLGAFDENGSLIGILHYILHPTTGSLTSACYMQDVYVPESARRQGIAKRLVWELADLGKAQNWARIYWFAENNNEAAQALYKNLGIALDFTLFMYPTE